MPFTCRLCKTKLETRKSLWHHRQIEHSTFEEETFHRSPWEDQVVKPWTNEEGDVIDEALRDIYFLNRDIILKKYASDNNSEKVKYTYNFPVSGGEINFRALMNSIYESQQRSFKINVSFGFILRHVSTSEYRFFIPYHNVLIFDRARLVSSARDLGDVIQDLELLSLNDNLLKQRPNTKWIPVMITNVTFSVYSTNFTLGNGRVKIPSWLRNLRGLKILSSKNDNMCAFRCIAFHFRNNNRIERLTKTLFRKWCLHKQIDNSKHFKGVALPDEIQELEEVFQININIFRVDETTRMVIPVFLSSVHRKLVRTFSSEMNLCSHKNHLSYISNLKRFAKKYKCKSCDKFFPTITQFKRHEKGSCWRKTIYKLPGGFYSPPKDIFKRLSDLAGIEVVEENRYYEWFTMFDFEALLLLNRAEAASKSTTWTREHRAISVAICSNVPGYTEARCIVNVDCVQLVSEMFSYLKEISIEAEKRLLYKLRKEKEELEENLHFWRLKCDEEANTNADDELMSIVSDEGDFSSVVFEEDLSDDEALRSSKSAVKMRNALSKLHKDLLQYCKQIPVLGFNSGNYDLNLIKNQLGTMFAKDPADFIVKKNNNYMCICNERFRFLDISQYLPPGTSYEQFLRTFNVSESKGFFCFEYLDSVEKLRETALPPISAFWSSLKNRNILEEEKYEEFQQRCNEFPDRDFNQVASDMNLACIPRSKEQNYEFLLKTWGENNMRSLKDLLIFYNEKDVRPGILAISRLVQFYFREMKVDIFKTALSAPGIARSVLFRMANKELHAFASIDQSNRDLFETIQANVVGGPAIVFCRRQKANETFIRKNENKLCKACVGYDANALYLYCLAQEMPVSYFVRWRKEENGLFKKERSERYVVAYDWLDWVAERDSVKISHKLNSGVEKSVGPYFLDGYSETPVKTAYEFLGCFWHQHPSENCTVYKNKDPKAVRYIKTQERERFIRKMGYEVVSIWECEFHRLFSTDKKLQKFLDDKNRALKRFSMATMKDEDLIKAVKDDSFFGMIEVDIHVPDELFEHFSEMSPIFVTTKIPFESIGEHMQDYIRKFGLSSLDRTLLVGGMRARRVLLATPLLKWYLLHGLVVSRIYQAVEFGRARCFGTFTEMVTTARRMADTDTDKKVLGELNKLIGNSAFGGLLMQKQKHKTCSFIRGAHKARLQVNTPQFVSLTPLMADHFEVISSKKRTVLDLPIQIGYFVLQYAKLRMLEFYYDFLCYFIDRSDFELCQMDTDSLYFAITGTKLIDVVRPEKSEEYKARLLSQCGTDDIDPHRDFLPRTCCSRHALRDKRTPGLFKLEGFGCEIISLNSKTYVLQKDENDATNFKLSSKGLNKRRISNPRNAFQDVLDSKESHSVVNTGFRARSNTVFTYDQKRNGITYFYCKRVVQDDGVSTVPLDMELFPAKMND